MAKTVAGKALEKYLQSKLNGIYELQSTISVGEYEGTITREDIEKLRKKLNNKTEDLEEMEKTLDSYETTVEGIDITIATQEGLALAPIITPAGPGLSPAIPLLAREKLKEAADDLKTVVKEQGKSAIKQAIDGLKAARETLNNIGKK